MGLFSFIGGLLGGGSTKKASRRAEGAQLGFLNRALDQSIAQRTQDRADFEPWRMAGSSALTAQEDLLGLRGSAVQQSSIDALLNSPMWRTLFRVGEESVLQNANATGGLRGGNTQRSLYEAGEETLAQLIERQLGHLGGLSGTGLSAATAGSAAGGNLTGQIANILGQQGQVRAGGILTRGGINSQLWNNAGSALDDSLKSILGALGF